MQLAGLSFHWSFLLLVVGSAISWTLLHFRFLPVARVAANDARGDQIAARKANLTMLVGLRTFAAFGVVVPLAVSALYAFAHNRIERFGAEFEKVEALVRTRDWLESFVSPFLTWSVVGLGVSIAVIFAVYLYARRSSTVRNWRNAFDARRDAILASLRTMSSDDLAKELQSIAPQRYAELLTRANDARTHNLASFAAALDQKLIEAKNAEGASIRVSINDLMSRLTALLNAETPDDPSKLAELQSERESLAVAISEFSQRVPVNWKTATAIGMISVADARAALDEPIGLSQEEVSNVLLEAKLSGHDAAALSRDRARPETLKEWVGAVMTGRLTVAAASMAGAVASLAAQAAIILSVIGLSIHGTGFGGLEAKARDMELSLIRTANATASVELPEPPECSGQDCASDEETEARLNAAFRHSVALAFQTSPRAAEWRRAAYAFAATDIRREILATAARPLSGTSTSIPSGEVHVSVDDAAPDLNARSEAVRKIDEAFERRVQELKRDPKAWTHLKRWAAQPVPAAYASDAMFRTMFGQMSMGDSHAFRAWTERYARDFSSRVRASADPYQSVHVSASSGPRVGASGSAYDKRVAANIDSDIADIVTTRRNNLASGIEDAGSLARRGAFAAGAGVRAPDYYSQNFPAKLAGSGAGISPDLGDVPGVPGGGGGGGGGGADDGKSPRTSRHANVPASRSYARVRFSGRVGGVVFGRMPDDGGTAPDVRKLVWELDAKKRLVRLSVETAGRNQILLGTFHPALVHHALAFAADGRPVAATMPIFRPQDGQLRIQGRQVIVHPAFEDTAFGCNSIQIDRFVDMFTSSQASTSAGAARIAVARRGVSALMVILENMAAPSSDLDASKLEEFVRQRRESIEGMTAAVRLYASSCAGEPSQCFPMQHYKSVDFSTASNVLKCVAKHGKDDGATDCILNLPSPQNKYWVDSGVRESAYVLDPDLNFLKRRTGQDDTYPIDFIIQAVPQTMEGDDVPTGDVADPWDFPLIKEDIRQAVKLAAAKDGPSTEIMRNVRDFVLLQRMFRNALAGNLGEQFPLRQLGALSRETAAYVRITRTEKWNMNSSFFELIGTVQSIVFEDVSPLVRGGKLSLTCSSAAAKIVRPSKLEPEIWGFLQGMHDLCANDKVPLEKLFSLRDALNELEVIDEVLTLPSKQGSTCSSL
ncbi:MAG TPA: hypothetical protein DCL54_07365 [Alphaproteobacteria bacterium]|nr:hypothetical protein [Alphaproteobacteria bacterium]